MITTSIFTAREFDSREFQSAPRSNITLAKGLLDRLLQTGRKLSTACQVRQERRELKTLSDHILNDIGIDRSSAQRESGRSFLDLPPGRF